MQTTRFKLIIYNFYNWSASSNLIFLDVIIFSRDLACSSVVRLYYCRSPTCCSLGALDGFTLGTYDDTELGPLEGLTEGITEGKFEGLLLGDWLGSVVGLVIGFINVTVLGSWYGKVLGTTLGDLVGL